MREALAVDFLLHRFCLAVILAALENELRRQRHTQQSERKNLQCLDQKRHGDRGVAVYAELACRECVYELEEPHVARRGAHDQSDIDAEETRETSRQWYRYVSSGSSKVKGPELTSP